MRRLLRRWADASLRKRNAFLERKNAQYLRALVNATERAKRAEALLREARDDA